MTSYNNDFPFLRILTCLEPKHIRNRRKNNHNVDKIRNTKSQGVIINRHARCQKKKYRHVHTNSSSSDKQRQYNN